MPESSNDVICAMPITMLVDGECCGAMSWKDNYTPICNHPMGPGGGCPNA